MPSTIVPPEPERSVEASVWFIEQVDRLFDSASGPCESLLIDRKL